MTSRHLLTCAVACALAASAPARGDELTCDTGPTWTCFKSGPCPLPALEGRLCAVGISEATSPEIGLAVAAARARVEVAAVLQSRVESFTRALTATSGSDTPSASASHTVSQTLARVAVVATHRSGSGAWFVLVAVPADVPPSGGAPR